MNIHEFQAKNLLRAYKVPLLNGKELSNLNDIPSILDELGGSVWVVKAQIHAGGRGKAGGVIVCKSKEQVHDACENLLNSTLVTHQTGPKGQKVKRLYIEQGCAIAKEYYLSLVLDRKNQCVSVIASAQGGMDIEEVADKHPQALLTLPIDPIIGVQGFHGRRLAFFLGVPYNASIQQLLQGVYQAFVDFDANLIEINPLITTADGQFIALDCKMSFDDNGLFKHPIIEQLRDIEEEDPAELEAHSHELNYVRLDGSIGCMVNGAGLAMATMDLIKKHNAEPANFLDVGGGATKERVSAALRIILNDSNVKGILVNIFGGIMRCDIIAQGIVDAAKEINLNVPMVVRLQGTNRDLGKQILQESGLNLVGIDDLEEAARQIVSLSK